MNGVREALFLQCAQFYPLIEVTFSLSECALFYNHLRDSAIYKNGTLFSLGCFSEYIFP